MSTPSSRRLLGAPLPSSHHFDSYFCLPFELCWWTVLFLKFWKYTSPTCVLLSLQNTEKKMNLPLPLDVSKLKAFQLQGALHPAPWPGALPMDPAGCFVSKPSLGSCSASLPWGDQPIPLFDPHFCSPSAAPVYMILCCKCQIFWYSAASTVILSMNTNCLESNEVLKLKFRKLHSTMVNDINPGKIICFLFQEAVIGELDNKVLTNISDPWEQCAKLLALLHASEHPQAFIKLYAAIKEEPQLQWLIDRIDKFTDQSVTELLQQLDITKTTGKRGCVRANGWQNI